MKAENLQLQLQAMAIMVRVDGMKAENALRVSRDEPPAYDQDDFNQYADEIDSLMQDVIF